MPAQIFQTGNLNVAGICHAISCQWINQSRRLNNVTTLQQLGSPAAMFMNWQLPNNWQGINANYHLPSNNVVTQPQLGGQWLAEQCTRINGYALIVLWGGGINVAAGAHAVSGHTVAVRKQAGGVQYFDPNIGSFQFASSLELYNWIPTDPNGPYMQYPALRIRQCEFVKV